MSLIRRALQRCGIDRAIAYTVFGRSWTFFAGPISLLIIARYLTGEEQGYYYTFGSVLGLYIFFELGLSFVIFQFASHEKSKLEWMPNGTIEGDPIAKDRLLSLLRKALVWYAFLAATVLAVLIPAGFAFFRSSASGNVHKPVAWQFPWVWVVCATAADLLSGPLVAVLEGGGLFTQIALVRTLQTIAGGLLTWVALISHARLLAAPVSNTVVVVVWWGYILATKRQFLRQVFTYRSAGNAIDWRSEVWPFQWKIAVTGISSYFIYLIFNPILFRYQGATIAGQMGMTMTVITAISTVAISWVSTKVSPLGTLIARAAYRDVDALFFPALWRSAAVYVGLAALLVAVVGGLSAIHHPLSHRMLPVGPMLILLTTGLLNHFVGAEALYLRAHKKEPFLVLSVVVAILTAGCTYYLARHYSLFAMVTGNLVITFVFSFVWGSWIFARKRSEWHRTPPSPLETGHIEPCPSLI